MKETFFYSEPVNSVLELVGNTPMVRINRLVNEDSAEIYAKIAAEQRAEIKPGDTLIEPTSGNTGIGMAFISAAKGYKLVLTMPETMSIERRNMLKAFGAELILTEGTEDMIGAVDKSNELADRKGYFQPQQFKNSANVETHRKTTAREIIAQAGRLDAFVAGVGTGGTITGVGEVLKKEFGEQVRIVAVEPSKSPVLSGGRPGLHEIQGIGAGFVPEVLNRNIIDKIVTVTDEEAFETTRSIIRQEGILCGVSSGANLFAALEVAEKLGKGKKVVTVFPDTGERYLSTSLFHTEKGTKYEGI
jgi:cysteine synthase A